MSDKPVLPWITRWVYPELRFIQTRQQLAELGEAYIKSPKKGFFQRWWVLVLTVLMAGLIVVWVSFIVIPSGWSTIIHGVGQVLSFSLVFVLLALANRHQYRRFVREYLQAHGIPICLQCGYDLRGQTEPRCSECGAAFDERLLQNEAFEAD